MTDAGDLAVIIHRLDDVTKRLDEVARRMDERDRVLADQYVPRREYELRVGELEKDNANQAAFKRQVAAGALVGLVLLVLNIVVVATRIPGAGA